MQSNVRHNNQVLTDTWNLALCGVLPLHLEHGCREQYTGVVKLSHLHETARADNVLLRKELIAELLAMVEEIPERTRGICGRLARLVLLFITWSISFSGTRHLRNAES